MQPSQQSFQVSACRHCRFYCPEGRRGGHCHRFDSLVHASWKACPLAMPAFAPSWEVLDRFSGYARDVIVGDPAIDTIESTTAVPGETSRRAGSDRQRENRGEALISGVNPKPVASKGYETGSYETAVYEVAVYEAAVYDTASYERPKLEREAIPVSA